ncbi:MAG: type 1 glutamine amidotransferase [Candidatus Dormibacteria bacterium]
MSPRALVLGLLYPREMNLYGDRGNLLALAHRARRRGLALEVVTIGLAHQDAGLIPTCSGFFIGGGQDLDQVRVAQDLVQAKGPALRQAVAEGAPLLAVCAGFQLLGSHYLAQDGTRIPGLGLLPMRTVAGSERLVGNLLVEADPALRLRQPLLVGFENHSGRTELESGLAPLGRVVRGRGNSGNSGSEGAWAGSVLGTYLHGPLLPKNPELADWWLRAALGRVGQTAELPPLDDSLEEGARLEAITKTLRPDRRSRFRLLGRGLAARRPG